MLDKLWDAEDHIAGIPVLFECPVNLPRARQQW